MGTDIHTEVWVNTYEHGWRELPVDHGDMAVFSAYEWLVGSHPDWLSARSYLFFEVLAGVRARHGLQPVAAGRGFPEWLPAPDDDDDEWWGDYGQSWATFTELQQALHRAAETWRLDYQEWQVRHILTKSQRVYGVADPDRVVLVFGFDS